MRTATCLLLIGFASACGSTNGGPHIDAIEVYASAPAIARGTSAQLTAVAYWSDGRRGDLTGVVTWSSDDPGVARCSHGGIVAGVNAGRTRVVATYGERQIATELEVTSPRLSRLQIADVHPRQVQGGGWSLVVLGAFSDGSLQELTASADFSSSNPGVASVNAAGNGPGEVTALHPGDALITARSGELSASVSLSVLPRTPRSIWVVAPEPRMSIGGESPVIAVGRYDDGSEIDLTRWAAWLSSDPASAVTVDGSNARLSAGEPGAVVVTALFDGVYGSTTVEIAAPSAQ